MKNVRRINEPREGWGCTRLRRRWVDRLEDASLGGLHDPGMTGASVKEASINMMAPIGYREKGVPY